MIEPQPFFSIIMPTYNRANFIPRAIHSVLSQKFISWELIVVDDASTDNTKDICTSYNDIRIEYIRQQHSERSAARNNGIDRAKGAYICFLDDDDYYLDNHLSSFYERIKQDNFRKSLYYCDRLEDYEGKLRDVPLLIYPARNNVEYVLLNLINVPQTSIPCEYLDTVRFSTSIRIGEDRDFLAQLASKYPIVHIPVRSHVVGIHPDRSVSIDNYLSYKENLETCRYLIKTYRSFLSRDAKKRIQAQSYRNMMLHQMTTRNHFMALYWLIRLCIQQSGCLNITDIKIWYSSLSSSRS